MLCGQATDKGKFRESNEDGVFSAVLRTEFSGKQLECGLFIVVDGMGGREDGQKATDMSIQAISQHILGHATKPEFMAVNEEFILQTINEAMLSANHALMQAGKRDENAPATELRFSGGASATLAVVVGSQAFIGHVGVTHLYHINPMICQRLTSIHLFSELLIEMGYLSRDDLPNMVFKNVIYKALGQIDELEVDLQIMPLSTGDYLLLGSDLYELQDTEIQQCILAAPDPQTACDRLIALVNERDGGGNISVVIVQV